MPTPNIGKDIGFGVIFKLSTTTTVLSTLATAIGNLIDIDGFANPIPRIDTTDIDDAAASCKPGTPEAGPGTVTIAYKQGDSGHNKLLAMNANRTVGKFHIVYPSTLYVNESIKGYVADVGLGRIARDTHLQRTISIQPTSAIGWSTGA